MLFTIILTMILLLVPMLLPADPDRTRLPFS